MQKHNHTNQSNRDGTREKNLKDLKRLEEQSEKFFGPEPLSNDTQDDPIEKWGRIIGRTLGVIAVIFLAYHLAVTYVLN